MNDIKFEKRKTIEQVEESTELAPKFDQDGLIPVVTTDFDSGEVLMQGYMNEEAFKKTISFGEAVYYSRSRKTLWAGIGVRRPLRKPHPFHGLQDKRLMRK